MRGSYVAVYSSTTLNLTHKNSLKFHYSNIALRIMFWIIVCCINYILIDERHGQSQQLPEYSSHDQQVYTAELLKTLPHHLSHEDTNTHSVVFSHGHDTKAVPSIGIHAAPCSDGAKPRYDASNNNMYKITETHAVTHMNTEKIDGSSRVPYEVALREAAGYGNRSCHELSDEEEQPPSSGAEDKVADGLHDNHVDSDNHTNVSTSFFARANPSFIQFSSHKPSDGPVKTHEFLNACRYALFLTVKIIIK